MSKIKVNEIEKASGSGITVPTGTSFTITDGLAISSVPTITQAKIDNEAINEAKLQVSNAPTNGYFLSAQSGNTGGLTWAEVGGGGKILQVVQAVKSDTASWTANATTRVATGLSASITPSATGSKVLIQYLINIGYPSNASQWFLHLFRDSTEINQGDASSSRKRAHYSWGGSYQGNLEDYMSNSMSGMFLDSPSTTSSTTYSIKHTDATTSGTFYINRSTRDNDAAGYDPRFVSNIILMEVGA